MAKTKAVVIFDKRTALSLYYHNAAGRLARKRVTFGVWLDEDKLNDLAIKASRNKSRRATDGAIHIEVHQVEELEK